MLFEASERYLREELTEIYACHGRRFLRCRLRFIAPLLIYAFDAAIRLLMPLMIADTLMPLRATPLIDTPASRAFYTL